MDWIKRTTGWAEAELRKLNIEDWGVQQRRIYWRWAGHTTRLVDDRWTVRAFQWEPSLGSRRVGRPAKRWVDEIWTFIAVHEDSRRLQYMLRHAGEVKEASRSKWQKIWKRCEDEFALLYV